MASLPGAFSDSFEKLSDTAKQTGKQLRQVPKDLLETGAQQVKGQTTDDNKNQGGEQGIEQVPTGTTQGQRPGKINKQQARQQLTPQQLLALQEKENKEKSMAMYRRIQEELDKLRKKESQETPAYIAGKPGAAKDKEEELALWKKEEERKKKEKKEKKISLPGLKGGPKGAGERLKHKTG